jgi:transcription antitermination protein NusB
LTISNPHSQLPSEQPDERTSHREEAAANPTDPERVRAVAVELLGRLKGIPYAPRVARRIFDDALDETELDEADRARAYGLAMGVIEHGAEIDRLISQIADAGQYAWATAAELDILRLGVLEECVQSGRSLNRAVRYARRLKLQFRREARAAAVQIIYGSDISGKPTDEVIEQRLEETALTLEGQKLARVLVRGVIDHRDTIGAEIANTAPAWPIGQMAAIDRTILSLAIFELLYCGETPQKVAINEAVELAKRFGGDNTARLVNGALGAFMSRTGSRRGLDARPTEADRKEGGKE